MPEAFYQYQVVAVAQMIQWEQAKTLMKDKQIGKSTNGFNGGILADDMVSSYYPPFAMSRKNMSS